jgi:hypothetical protein
MGDLALDQRRQARPQAEGRDEQLAVVSLPRVAGQKVEQVRGVGADRRVTAQQPQIGVDPRRCGIVVAGAQMHLAPQPITLAPHDERDLGVRFQADQPIRAIALEKTLIKHY